MRIFKYFMFLILCSTVILYFVKQYNIKNQIYNKVDKIMDNNNITEEQEEKYEIFYSPPNNKLNNPKIIVYKNKRILELYGDDNLIGRFKVALGGAPEGNKNVEGDLKTPIGKYYICTRNDKSKFTLFMGINYPNSDDGKRGFDNNLIDQNTLNTINEAERLGIQPPWKTPLGGEVGIHGGGNKYDWTQGCIALSDEDIRILWEHTPMNTPVEIYE